MADAFSCGVVLLAAGGSSRMGRPKQLLTVHGKPLVRHLAELVAQAPVAPVVVVLGAQATEIEPALAGLPVRVVSNPAWSEGLGSSLRAGVAAARNQAPQLDAIIIALADQPELPPAHLAALIAKFRQGGCSIVASSTGDVAVPPVLFAARWFDELERITGDQGARALLRDRGNEIATVPFASNADLDTPEDYERYTRTGR
jgi:molybdenum cofactor cytidylyltransferase